MYIKFPLSTGWPVNKQRADFPKGNDTSAVESLSTSYQFDETQTEFNKIIKAIEKKVLKTIQILCKKNQLFLLYIKK